MPRFQSVLCSAFGTAEPLIKTVRSLFSASYYINRSISIAPLAAIMRERLDGRLRSPKEERPVTVIILLDII